MIIDGRRTGRTTALLKAAKSINAVFVCPTNQMAKHIKQDYEDAKDLVVIGLDALTPGTVYPVVIYDHTVTERYLDQYNNPNYKKIRELLIPLIRELDI